MIYIFVDFDGPMLPGKLASLDQNKELFNAIHSRQPYSHLLPIFDPFAIYILNQLSLKINAQVIFSTNWAMVLGSDIENTKEYLKKCLISNGYKGKFAEEVLTPKRLSSSRHSEIYLWLEDNFNIDTDLYVILDDLDTSLVKIYHPEYQGYIIQVDYNNGISWEQYKQLNKFLGIEKTHLLL